MQPKLFWSPSANQGRGGVFEDGHSAMPEDARPVSAARWASLLDAQAAGATITSDAKGKPVATFTNPGVEIQRAHCIRTVKAEAAKRIDRVFPVWRQLNAMQAGDTGHIGWKQIAAIRAASDLIEGEIAAAPDPALIPLGTHPLWPEID